MCTIIEQHALYLIKEAIKLQSTKETRKILNDALIDIREDKLGEYHQVEKDEIDNLIKVESANTSVKPS